jgi:hypothetical protein
MIYSTTQERKYTEKQRNDAYVDWCERQEQLDDLSPASLRKKCGISQVARDHKIGRSSLSLYIKAQKIKQKEKEKNGIKD